MYSTRAIELHFWIATIGIVLYIAAMWIAGVMQGLMWRAVNPDGTLTYSFVESVKATYPFYVIRVCGGLLYLTGMLIMAWNTIMTVANGRAVPADPGRGRSRLSLKENNTWRANTSHLVTRRSRPATS
jgi:cytochrome c oxidase cbb3-type subunit 1